MIHSYSESFAKRMTPEAASCYSLLCKYAQYGHWIGQASLAWQLFVSFKDSDKRKVRFIINRLRVEFGLPIISGPKGYRLAQDEDDLILFCHQLKIKAKSATKSYFETYRAMLKNIKSEDPSLFEFMNA